MTVSRKIVSPPIAVPARRRAGFSFTEILFAVMILAIGFIMVAAMFPVAIKQTQESLDETTAADMAKEAAAILARIANDGVANPSPFGYNSSAGTNYPATKGTFPDTKGLVVCYSVGSGVWPPAGMSVTQSVPPFWNLCAGNLVSASDARFAWIPFYRRGTSMGTSGAPSNYAQVIIIPVLDRNTPNYSGSTTGFVSTGTSGINGAFDLNALPPAGGGSAYANLQGRMVGAIFSMGMPSAKGPYPDAVSIVADPGPTTYSPLSPPSPPQGLNTDASAQAVAAPGAYLIVADDSALGNTSTTLNLPSCNGYTYQLGNPYTIPGTSGPPTPVAGTYFLAPGNDMKGSRFQPVPYTAGPPATTTNVVSAASATPPGKTATNTVRCYIVGRGFNNPTAAVPDTTITGPAMDISVFSTIVKVPN